MKRIVSIQDISDIGKCSLTAALPVISAMGVECAVLPTAVLTIPVCALVFGCVRRIHAEFKIDNGIV